MTGMETEEIRKNLASEQERLEGIRLDIRSGDDLEDSADGNTGGELSSADQHPADAASETTQRAVSLSMLEQIDSELSDVESAMQKLDQGTYGACEACGKPIGDERLAAIPTARYCLEDQSRAEATGYSSASSIDTPAGGSASPI